MTFETWKQQHATEIDWLSGLVRRLLKLAYEAGFREGITQVKGDKIDPEVPGHEDSYS